jgi:hypothetical protein
MHPRLTSPRHARAVALACVALMTLCPWSAKLAEALAEPSTLVVVVDADSAPNALNAAILAAIEAEVGDLKVHLQVASVRGAGDIRSRLDQALAARTAEGRRLGALWFDTSQLGDFLLFLANADGTRVLVRRIHVGTREEGAAVEEIAVVVRSTVSALLEGGTLGTASIAPAPPPAVGSSGLARGDGPAAAASTAPPDQLPGSSVALVPPSLPRASIRTPVADRPRIPLAELGVSYVGTVFSSPGSWQSGLSLSARYVAAFHGYLGASYDFISPENVVADGFALELSRHPLGVAAGYQRVVRSRFRLEGELAFVIDPVSRTTSTTTAGYQPTSSDTRALLALAPRARAAWNPLWQTWLTVGGGVDVVVNHFTYQAPPSTPLVDPLVVRPRVELGLALDLP